MANMSSGLGRYPVFADKNNLLPSKDLGGEWACKPSSVQDGEPSVGGHSSRACVATGFQLPTRGPSGPLDRPPIWNCSGWGLASRLVTKPLVRSYRTFSPLPVRLPRT